MRFGPFRILKKETDLGDAVHKGTQIAEVLPVTISDLNLVNFHHGCTDGRADNFTSSSSSEDEVVCRVRGSRWKTIL